MPSAGLCCAHCSFRNKRTSVFLGSGRPLLFFFLPGCYCILFGTTNSAAVLFFAIQIVMLGFGLLCFLARDEHVENPWLHAGIAEKSISLANLWA